jgi:hypothetical protein
MSSVAVSQAIRDAFELLSTSSTMHERLEEVMRSGGGDISY